MRARAPLRLLPLLLLGLAASACSFTEAINTYCTETELCACEGDDCCIKAGNACEGTLCCGRLVCGEGTCVQGPDQPFLTITPPSVDFGIYAPSGPDPAPFQIFVVTNVGNQPTAVLQRRIRGDSSDLSITEDACIDRVLAAGESCDVRVDVTPVSGGSKQMTFGYFEAPDVDANAVASVLIR